MASLNKRRALVCAGLAVSSVLVAAAAQGCILYVSSKYTTMVKDHSPSSTQTGPPIMRTTDSENSTFTLADRSFTQHTTTSRGYPLTRVYS